MVDPEAHFERCVRMYERLVPIAEGLDIRLIIHPSDPPLPQTEFSPYAGRASWTPSPAPTAGCSTASGRATSPGQHLRRHPGLRRQGKIFHTHFRNVRGTIPTHGGYQEVALGDGDMNMLRVVQTLRSISFDGGLQIDHLPRFDGDNGFQGMAATTPWATCGPSWPALEVARARRVPCRLPVPGVDPGAGAR